MVALVEAYNWTPAQIRECTYRELQVLVDSWGRQRPVRR